MVLNKISIESMGGQDLLKCSGIKKGKKEVEDPSDRSEISTYEMVESR